MTKKELLIDVSNSHSAFLLCCFHDNEHDMPSASDRGKEGTHSLSYCAKIISLASLFSFCFWLRCTHNSLESSVYPATLQYYFHLTNVFIIFLHTMCMCMDVYVHFVRVFFLTIATTAAPAPARAQTNRWKVMSSCGKENKLGKQIKENIYSNALSQCFDSIHAK